MSGAVKVVTREYDPDTGSVLDGDMSSLFFGTVGPGLKSAVKVVDMAASGAYRIFNVKLGIVADDIGGRKVSDVFYVSASDSVSPAEPTAAFPGVNSSGTGSDTNNVAIGQKTDSSESRYVSLMVKAPERPIRCGTCRFVWFFDYE